MDLSTSKWGKNWQAVVKAVMNFGVTRNNGNFLQAEVITTF